ncbi:MAG: L,D-transpeptidase [Mycobacteriales bacterium]
MFQRILVVGGVSVVLAATGAGGFAVLDSGAAPARQPAPPPPPVVVTVPSAPGGIQPWSKPLEIVVSGGGLAAATVTATGGGTLAGTLAPRGWVSTGQLVPTTSYLATLAVDQPGSLPVVRSVRVTTTDAPRLNGIVTPGEGDVVGVGMPVIVAFNRAVPVSAQAAVAHRLTVSSEPAVAGGWRWMDPTTLHWRPAHYWPAHAQVHVRFDLAGLELPGGIWGAPILITVNYSIGDALVSFVNVAQHTMTVTRNGRTIAVLPVSAGRPEYPTHSGVHIVLDKSPVVLMDSATVGIPVNSPNGYYENVYWDVRISDSGEFVHAAPWSVAEQGITNVSHGCVNVSPANAQWFYGLATRGDVVDVIGGPPPSQTDPGTEDWNTSPGAWQS